MKYVIDIDGTVAEELPTFQRCLAKPLPGAVESINKLYDNGHKIIFYSARSWNEYEATEDWLKRYGFKYHQLILGKPAGDFWIDDRAIKFTGWEKVNKEINNV